MTSVYVRQRKGADAKLHLYMDYYPALFNPITGNTRKHECEKEVCPIKPPTLAEMIVFRMHEMGLTQKELSKALDMTAPRLSEIFNGRKDPTYRQAQKIATTLKIDANIVLAV